MKHKIAPFILSFIIILADQASKLLIDLYVPIHTIAWSAFGDFLRIIHVRNTAIAFSMGRNLSDPVKLIFFIIVPVLLLLALIIYLLKKDDFTRPQRWFLAGIIGGGIGNIIDRIFRSDGVIDFIDVKFYGLLGFERWPTFNVADSAIVVCAILLGISIFFEGKMNEQKA